MMNPRFMLARVRKRVTDAVAEAWRTTHRLVTKRASYTKKYGMRAWDYSASQWHERKTRDRSRYNPHQGKRECLRRRIHGFAGQRATGMRAAKAFETC